MRRRDFLTLLGGAAATWPLATVCAQEAGSSYRVGCLLPNPRGAPHDALFAALGRSGFVEGKNLGVEWRAFGQRADMAAEFAAALVKLQPDVLLAGGDDAIRACGQATTKIPVLGITEDLVGAGFVTTAAKPGGNTTGVSMLASELDAQRQDILVEAIPKLRRIAILADTNATTRRQSQALQDAARRRGVESSVHWITRPEEIVPAIDAARKSHAGAIAVLASPFLYGNRAEIIKLAAALRLPAIYQYPEIAEEGGLIGYGPRLVQIYEGPIAQQLIKILRGAKPADMPVERPAKFDLVINLQTAKAIGIEITPSVASRADKRI
jgi:putative ABC transport system substrate-binding protein